MSRFTHNPEDLIIIDDLIMPLSFFITKEKDYVIPSGMITQTYIQGDSYSASTGKTQTFYKIPWKEGDTYISKKEKYKIAYEAYMAKMPLK